VLRGALPSVWVAGEVQRVFRSRAGHVYFELIEKGERDSVCGKLDAVLWRSHASRVDALLRRTGQGLEEGVQLRCRGNVDFYGVGGRLQLVVQQVDPVFTLGLLAQRRRETLLALEAAGLLDLNRALALPTLPLAVGLVTSHESAAYHDFLSTLQESGYGFRVLLVHSAVQGQAAEAQVVSALATLRATGVDCIVLTRGGGSRSDLAVFDSRAIAEAVARADVPVLTGLGHQIDEAIADRVAHTPFKTPTKVAEFLIERVRRGDEALEALAAALGRGATDRLRDAREALGSAERGVEAARRRLDSAGDRLEELARALARTARGRLWAESRRGRDLGGRLGAAARRRLEREGPRPEQLGRRIAALAAARVRREETRLDGAGRLIRELRPERVLERGYSLTRDARGKLLTDASRARPDEEITTRLATGTLTSRVTAIEETP
jgi:exodeoxyribonuclease VII large subunit